VQFPTNLTRYISPSASQSSGSTASFDYSGQDDLSKRKDALAQVRSKQFVDLYSGNIPGSVENSHVIRDLLDAINNPRTPLARVSSVRNDSASDVRGPSFEGDSPPIPMPQGGGAKPAAPLGVPPKPASAAPPPKPGSPVNPMVARGGRDPTTIPPDEVFGSPDHDMNYTVLSDPRGRDTRRASGMA
jgi:hypothetical protein